jgi:hypothetical protein
MAPIPSHRVALWVFFTTCLFAPVAAHPQQHMDHSNQIAEDVLTGDAIPDRVAERVVFNALAEPAPHNRTDHCFRFRDAYGPPVQPTTCEPGGAFDALVGYFAGPSGKAPLIAALEEYYTKEKAMHAVSMETRKQLVASKDWTGLANEQDSYAESITAFAESLYNRAFSQMDRRGQERMARALKGLKNMNLKVSPNDHTVISWYREHGTLVVPPGFSPPPPPSNVSMTPAYAVFSIVNINLITGVAYVEEGIEGTTNPCNESCVTATHTANEKFQPAGSDGGTKSEKNCAGPAYDTMSTGCSYTFSFMSHDGMSMGVAALCTNVGVIYRQSPFNLH